MSFEGVSLVIHIQGTLIKIQIEYDDMIICKEPCFLFFLIINLSKEQYNGNLYVVVDAHLNPVLNYELV